MIERWLIVVVGLLIFDGNWVFVLVVFILGEFIIVYYFCRIIILVSIGVNYIIMR